MYERAKALHPEWVKEKFRLDNERPKLKEIQLRMDEKYTVDRTENPTINHIDHCIEIIEEVEANHKGQYDEKILNHNEKYKLGLQYIQMLQDPKKFKYLDRLAGGEQAFALRMNLPPDDLKQYKVLEETIEANDQLKIKLLAQRKKIVKQARFNSVQPEKKIVSKLSAAAQ